ncbi:cytosine deaminase [Pusillimonas sp. T2]|uniref:cytosine deaminase n=1 Tax=Pusillimonas sp. T2 TaxID=1548123 RepID=UPI000B9D265C|nr:cytosine deaminase [Pusillimonas sp. T2]OXR48461.1 cytosine deaminase [Pusillimonas sp. T2]
MKVSNAQLYGQNGLWDIELAHGVIQTVTPASRAKQEPLPAIAEQLDATCIDAKGALVIPPYVEPHIHLDATQTAGQPRWNQSGTLFEGIACWAERKAQLTIDDVKQRAWHTLKWQIANGILHVRTHVDVSDPTLTALKAMLEVRSEIAPWLDLQIVAFPQEGILSYPNGEALLEEALKLGADVVGAIPHFEFTREYGVESLHKAVALACRYDRPVDVHCDETDDEQSRFLETLAMLAHREGLGARVTASHTTAMHSYNGAYTSRLMRLLALSKINFVSNPLVNIHLQGRFDTYPKRRGLTRVDELMSHGLNMCFGHDDVFDPWYPLGTANLLQVLHMGMHATQMMGYEQLEQGLDLVTRNAAITLGLEGYGLAPGNAANLVILPATSGFDALRRQVPAQYVIRQGKVIAHTQPSQTQIWLGTAEPVDYGQMR